MEHRKAVLVVALTLLAAGCTDPGGICDPLELEEALAGAYPTETVQAGACRITGAFTVPAGVTLRGRGRGETTIVGAAGAAAVRVIPGAEPAVLADLGVRSEGPVGVLVRGEGGAAVLESIAVRASRGVAIGVEGLDRVEVRGARLEGPVTRDNAGQIPPEPAPEDWATHGLVLVRVADAVLSDVDANGFARFGVLIVDGETDWRTGDASANLGSGLMVHGGHAFLEGLVLCGMMQGVSLIPPYGAVFVAGAEVETQGLEVCDCEGPGTIHELASVRHVDLSAHGNRDAAVWVQDSPAFELSGAGTSISGNRFAGVVLVDSGEARLAGGTIEGSVTASRIFRTLGTVAVGDGVQLVRPSGRVDLSSLRLVENERVGLLLELDGSTDPAITLDGVTVSGSGAELGAVAQGPAVPEGWDSGVLREGATGANDAAHTGELQIVDLVAPDDMPEITAVVDRGVEAIVGDL